MTDAQQPVRRSALHRPAAPVNAAGSELAAWLEQSRPIPDATPRLPADTKLCVAMATYGDFDGVWFSISSVLLHHRELVDDLSFVVIDNCPTSPVSAALKELERHFPRYRYVPFRAFRGTSCRDIAFREAQAEIVCCIDSHVLIAPGGLAALVDYVDARPGCQDLIQGPVLGEDGVNVLGTHQEPEWFAGLFGRWAVRQDWLAAGIPYDLPLQGLGLFACRRDAWPGFHPLMRGFGGEEGYLHEKVRRRGGRTVGLPQLVWAHRFPRPGGVPFPMVGTERMRNFELGWAELGWDPRPMRAYLRSVGGTDGDLAAAQRAVTHPLASVEAIMVASGPNPQRWANVRHRAYDLEFDWRLERLPTSPDLQPRCTCALQAAVREADRRGLDSVALLADDATFGAGFLADVARLTGRLPSGWQLWAAADGAGRPDGGIVAVHRRAFSRVLAADGCRPGHRPLTGLLAALDATLLPPDAVSVADDPDRPLPAPPR